MRRAWLLALLLLAGRASAARRAPHPTIPRPPAAVTPPIVPAPLPAAPRALPALHETAARLPQAASAAAAKTVLDRLFLGRRGAAEAQAVWAGAASEGAAAPLAPWSTARQLERLAASPRAPGATFRFAVIGDAEPGRFRLWRWLFNHGGRGAFERLLTQAAREPVDFVIQLGDMVSRGTPKLFARFLQILERVRPAAPYLTVLGNHDRESPHGRSDSSLYRRLFGAPDYRFDHGGVRFVVLDTSGFGVDSSRLEWLDRALDAPGPKIVFTHVPPWWLRPWTDFKGMRGVAGFRRGAREFGRILERHGVQRVYLGHIHGLGSQHISGVRYVLSGGGGSPLFPSGVRKHNRYHHYLVVEVGPDGIRETVQRLDGRRHPLP